VGPRARLDRRRKSRPPPGFDPRTVHPIAQSLYRLSYLAHKCAEYKYKFIYAPQYSMSFNVTIFMKLPLPPICYNVLVLFQSPLHDLLLKFYCYCQAFVCYKWTNSSSISCGTELQARSSQVQFLMVSLGFFVDIILPSHTTALGSTQPLTEMSTRNNSSGVKAARAYG
jgi:hypothetical protein